MSSEWSKIDLLKQTYQDYEFPKVSIVVPSYNCSQTIASTIDSILAQDYPSFEVLVVDAESSDRTVEAIKRFRDDRIHLYSYSEFQRYEMMNRGIAHAQGEYINFLFPGDFYLSNYALRMMMTIALENKKPDLVYCGSLLRDGKTEVKILYRILNINQLKRGQQPTSLQACWFKRESLIEIGKFPQNYYLRGGFDLLCRYALKPSFTFASTKRIFTDYDLRWVTKRMVIRHFWETMRTIYRYFGFLTVVSWLFVQKDTKRFIKLSWRSAKIAITGR